MAYFTEQALTYSECLSKIHSKYGEKAKVLMWKTIQRGGVFGIGSHEEVEILGTFGEQAGLLPSAPRPGFNLEEEKRKILAAAGKDHTLQTLLKEVRNLSDKVDSKLAVRPARDETREHPALAKLEEDFRLNDFSLSYTRAMIDRARREFALEELDDYDAVQRKVLRWIGESISIYRENSDALPRPGRKRPRIIVLVGATGAGKTTTIAKLAALYGELSGGRLQKEVRLITLDYYRIGGKEQIEAYGRILEIPSSLALSHEDLHKLIELYRRDVDFVLVDTIGKSPRDYGELGKMKAVLDACGPRAETQLCVSASTKSSDIAEILRQFEPFKYRSVIITKLDETERLGNVISALAEASKSVSFVTTGQLVPAHIERATVMRFLLGLEGFSIVSREELSKYFAEPEPAGAAVPAGIMVPAAEPDKGA